ncbi:MAG: hypothetical protein LBR64_10325 [Dysgonamonadaceae bacterium]|jgi:hypothetical protein|nr:hypothetical protein [Dysgonamonadaceae bacterium]
MSKVKTVAFIVTFVLSTIIINAQNYSDSPYSMYGYGKLADKAFAAQRGMGGIGYGFRDNHYINPMNPASFSKVDSLTFMFDMGLTGNYATFKDKTGSASDWNGNVDYMAFQFRLLRGLGIGVGLEPFSYVGYSYNDNTYTQSSTETDSVYVYRNFSGTGGLSKVYGALSYNFFDRLALGVKVSYMFGDNVKLKTITPAIGYSSVYADTLRSSGITYDFGLQYVQPLGSRQTLVVGAVFSPKQEINTRIATSELRGSVYDKNYTTTDSIFEIPMSIGIGATYNKLNKTTLGIDALYEKWADARFYNVTGALADRLKISLGGEYIPDANSGKLFSRIRYRAGLNYTNSYIRIGGEGYKMIGANIGFGIPMVDRRSFINLALEYSRLIPDVSSYITEQYFQLTLSYTFNQAWFLKQKIQ